MSARKRTALLIVHCAATKPSMDIGAIEIDRWHRSRGWAGNGYHYVIRRDGTLEPGRDPRSIGAHAKGHNAESVGICMVGGVDDNGEPEDNFSISQYVCLKELLVELHDLSYPTATVIGHNEVSSKACPSFDVQAWLVKSGLERMAKAEDADLCPNCGHILS